MDRSVSALNFVDDKDGNRLRFRAVNRPTQSWKEEVALTALNIQRTATKPIWICLSGGIDSELICHTFLQLKIPFQVLTIEHSTGGNGDDIVWANDWCKANGVHQKIMRFDTIKFFSEYIPEKLKTGFYSPCPFRFFQLFLMETIDALGGFGVLGVGEQRYFFDPENQQAYLKLDSGLQSVQAYAGDRHVPYFFYDNPEIMLAYIECPQVRTTLDHPEILAHKENVFLLKRMVYQTYFPHLKTRAKLDGWESVALQFAVARSRLEAQAGARTKYFQIPVPELEAQLRGSRVVAT